MTADEVAIKYHVSKTTLWRNVKILVLGWAITSEQLPRIQHCPKADRKATAAVAMECYTLLPQRFQFLLHRMTSYFS